MNGEIANEDNSERKIGNQLNVSFSNYSNKNRTYPSIKPKHATNENNYESDIEKVAVPSSN